MLVTRKRMVDNLIEQKTRNVGTILCPPDTGYQPHAVPGSGKTALLEAAIDALKEEFRITVIEGDLETENDAERIRAKGVTAVQITTGTACHLDAYTVHGALHAMSLDEVDILFIENVGNLVCPVSFDLGQHRNVMLLSVTKGDDKPANVEPNENENSFSIIM